MKKITIGILAHVDAGKTTCIESMLYLSSQIKKVGRVDHKDSFLDFDKQERERGITIYSKPAHFDWKETEIFVIDTPGHVDFSSEMERVLQVLDAAIVLISAQEGIQAHTKTILQCLEQYNIPILFFINKMDIAYKAKAEILEEMQHSFSENCIDLASDDAQEQLAMINDSMLASFLEKGEVEREQIQEAFYTRQLYPLYFGSALKLDGVSELLDGIDRLLIGKQYPTEFGAKIFKIDEEGNAYVKITGGSLQVKETINGEKIDQIRIYNGQKYKTVQNVDSGDICVLKGLKNVQVGEGLGREKNSPKPLLSGWLEYELLLPEGMDPQQIWPFCQRLEKEDPALKLQYDEVKKKISLSLMGEVQKEILANNIYKGTGYHVGFTQGKVVFKETIKDKVYGVGHFEPLRHYAEVHVVLEPLPPGSGIQIVNENKMENLSLGWQQQIMHALHYPHKGVLIGSLLSDVRIKWIAGAGNLKHTSAQDFKQAAKRAVRQALKKAQSIVLEPYYDFEIEVPTAALSRTLYALENHYADFEIESSLEDTAIIKGKGPVRFFINFQSELIAFSQGKGKIQMGTTHYYPAKDQEQIVQESTYDPEADLANPTGSIFCAQGAGFYVPYDEVEAYMHLHPLDHEVSSSYARVRYKVSDAEVKRVFEQISGSNKKEKVHKPHPKTKTDLPFQKVEIQERKPECLVVDGYNMIFGWKSLRDLARVDYNAARERLIDMIVNYQGYKGIDVYLVFDAYRRKETSARDEQRGRTKIIFTRYGETADSYIEKLVHRLKNTYTIMVATSDGLIQNSILAQGAMRLSALELEGRVNRINTQALNHLK